MDTKQCTCVIKLYSELTKHPPEFKDSHKNSFFFRRLVSFLIDGIPYLFRLALHKCCPKSPGGRFAIYPDICWELRIWERFWLGFPNIYLAERIIEIPFVGLVINPVCGLLNLFEFQTTIAGNQYDEQRTVRSKKRHSEMEQSEQSLSLEITLTYKGPTNISVFAVIVSVLVNHIS